MLKIKRKFSPVAEADLLNKISLYLSAQLSILEALQLVGNQMSKRLEKKAVADWCRLIEHGQTLSQAFSLSGAVKLSSGSVSAVRFGEQSAQLPVVLSQASIRLKKAIELRKKVSAALIYPLLILTGTLFLTAGLLVFVFPRITPVFDTLKIDLPASTRMLIWLSRVFADRWWQIILLILVVVLGFSLSVKFIRGFRTRLESLLLRLPIAGRMIRARFAFNIFDSLSLLIRGGASLETALAQVAEAMRFIVYKEIMFSAGEAVTIGKPLSGFLKKQKSAFAGYVGEIVFVGERTGNLMNSFDDVANIAKNELEDELRKLVIFLEPALMILMTLLVGFVAISIILPIYGATSHFQGL